MRLPLLVVFALGQVAAGSACRTSTRTNRVGQVFAPGQVAAAHPLDPLTKAELADAAAIVGASKSFPTGGLYAMIALREPDKAKILAWKPGREWTREAEVVVLDRKANRAYQGIVDLGGHKLTAWNPLPGKQPLVLLAEYNIMPQIVKADPRWQAAMRKRGITDFSKVWIDVWANGHLVPNGQEGARLLRGVSFLKDGDLNFYGRPIEGVIAIVNMNTLKVVDVIDTGVVPIDSPEHNAIQMQETVLASEQAAQRDVDLASARMWKIFDPAHTTALGYHPGYLLVPGQTSLPYLTPAATVRQRAPFLNHHFWVTRYKAGELYAAGDYPNQADPGDGIERYSTDDESLAGKDLVTWYTMGVTHIPRPEEWPVMPAHHIGFTLLPAAFFERNPALDVPR